MAKQSKNSQIILTVVIGFAAALLGELFPDELKESFAKLFPISFNIIWIILIITVAIISIYLALRGARQEKLKAFNSKPLNQTNKNMTVKNLQNLANEGKFLELFSILDKCFQDNPKYQYSNLKQNIEHELNQGNAPKPAQMQGLLVFLNSDAVRECLGNLPSKTENQNFNSEQSSRVINAQNYIENVQNLNIDQRNQTNGND